VFSPAAAAGEYGQYCGECHGAEGNAIPTADLSDPELANRFRRSLQILAMLRREAEEGGPHSEVPLPSPQEAANIAEQIQQLASGEPAAATSRFTINNYVDALVGYRGSATYVQDCEDGSDTVYTCTPSDYFNPRGMGRAFINSLLVTIPASILPILFAAFAGYAFAWLDFHGRYILFAILVGLQVVPLQMTLVPISRLYADLDLNQTFLGVWLFHTGFGMPYAIYLMRNFLGTLPRDLSRWHCQPSPRWASSSSCGCGTTCWCPWSSWAAPTRS
jgi:alpha-glucoside transport system permease protein